MSATAPWGRLRCGYLFTRQDGFILKPVVAANMFRGPEAVGGRLHFEENQMIFKSHGFNIQTGDTAIPYADIAGVQKRNTLGLVPNGIHVTMKSGIAYKFVVWNRNEIIQFLSEKMNG